MALPAPTYEGIKKAIKAHEFAPVYLLHGEEGYFTDALAAEFENVLSEDEKAFNQYVLYAPETEPTSWQSSRLISPTLCRQPCL